MQETKSFSIAMSKRKQNLQKNSERKGLSQSDDLEKFKDLTLADFKVMGIVGKVSQDCKAETFYCILS